MNKLENARAEINRIDEEMARLWLERTEAVRDVAEYKSEHGLSVVDKSREAALLEKNLMLIPEELRGLYSDFHRAVVGVSKRYQRKLLSCPPDALTLDLGERSYEILIRRGALKNAREFMDLDRRVLVVTDDGVPGEYAKTVAEQCAEAAIVTLKQGEQTKNLDSFRALLKEMLGRGFTRKDCVVAVGGGVIGDLAGYAAASYMRGIDFYNIPTTTLSQIDSSIGGKVAVDLDGYKNTVGAFYQPKFVLVDPDVLKTLDGRQVSAGLAEAVKMALCFDKELFELFESADPLENIDEIIRRSLMIKKTVVEKDETEGGLRKVLNFGHTVGHGIETAENGRLIHGECVAIGMLPMCSHDVRERLLGVMKKLGLPLEVKAPAEDIKRAMSHDKKSEAGGVNVVRVKRAGEYEIEKMSFSELDDLLDKFLAEGIG